MNITDQNAAEHSAEHGAGHTAEHASDGNSSANTVATLRRLLNHATHPSHTTPRHTTLRHPVNPVEVAPSASLLGAPGSGKTHTLVQFIVDSILSGERQTDEILLLTSDRQSATALRDRIVLDLNRPVPGPMARSVGSLAFEIVNEHSIQAGRGPVILLTGGEQDQIFEQILSDGAAESGAKTVTDPAWPDFLSEDVRELLGFRTELRDLWLRSIELGVDPVHELPALASDRYREQWAAAAQFFAQYQHYLVDRGITALDSATLVSRAVEIVEMEEFGNDSRIAKLKVLLLDDAQETVHSTKRLLQAFVNRGVRLIVAGNPDQMTARFRGAIPEFVGQLSRFLTAPPTRNGSGSVLQLPVEQFSLTGQYRFGEDTARALRTLVSQIGTAGSVAQRRISAKVDADVAAKVATQGDAGVGVAIGTDAEPSSQVQVEPSSQVRVELADSPGTEVQLIAAELRKAFFAANTVKAWNEMAVIVRSRGQIPALMHELSSYDIPVRYGAAQEPLRDDPVARGLLTMAGIALGHIELNAAIIAELVTGPIGGMARIEWRNLRRLLLLEELGEDETRTVDQVLVQLFHEPQALNYFPQNSATRKLLTVIDSLRAVQPETETIEEILWGIWQRSKLEKSLLTTSQGTGIMATAAGSSLDAAVALFMLAAREVERDPHADPVRFVAHLLETDLPEDNLAPKYLGPSVTLLTPNAAVGKQFRHVVVAGLQENVWPNPRIRDSLLGATDLLERFESASKPASQSGSQPGSQLSSQPGSEIGNKRQEVIQDEMRMFVQAISRSSETVLITAVDDAEAGASTFIYALIDSVTDHPFSFEHPKVMTETDISGLTLRKMVAESRKRLISAPNEESTAEAVETLRQLDAAGIPGAAPEQWYGIAPISTEEPLHGPNDTVRITPSTLEKFQNHPLSWLIGYLAGEKPNNNMAYGTLLHEIFENPGPDIEQSALMTKFRDQLSRLHFEADWLREQEIIKAAAHIERMSNYLKRARDRNDSVPYAEVPFQVDHDRVRLSGTVDRVEMSESGEIVVIDLKTGSAPTGNEVEENLQLRSYQYAIHKEALEGIDPAKLVGAKIVTLKENMARNPGFPKELDQTKKTDQDHEEFGELLMITAADMSQSFFLAPLSTALERDQKYKNALIHIIGTVSD